MPLDDLPLFPLHTVLFPDGLLPLQIFEVRYLDLMKRCEASGEPFGVVMLQRGSEVRRAPAGGPGPQPAETFADVGTLATLERVERPQPGLMLVQCRGGPRFTLTGHAQRPHGLWTGQATLLPDDAAAAVPADLVSLAPRLQDALRALGDDAPVAAAVPHSDPRWHDAGWLSNRWSELLPITAAERHRLMTLDNPLWRLELVAEWLERLARQADTAR